MEVKGILDKIRRQEEAAKEYFLALEIDHQAVKGAVWAVEEGRIKTVSIGKKAFWREEAALLKAADAALSSASENYSFEEKVREPNKIIFGLPADWVEEDKISPEKLTLLKEISQKLELEPVGFVVTQEAITHYLKAIEGVPPTVVLISLSPDQLSLNLIRLGKMRPTQVIKRSSDLGEDIIEGLSRYQEKEAFPARILLYNHEAELEEAKQALVDYAWQEERVKDKDVVFLHLPKVEILASDFDIEAVALAGGKEVARAAGLTANFVKEKKTPSDAEPEETLPEVETEKAVKEKEAISMAADFGFFENEDISEKKVEAPSEAAPEEPLPEVEQEEQAFPKPLPESPSRPLKSEKTIWSKLKLDGLKKLKPASFGSFLAKLKLPGKPPLVGSLVIGVLLLLLGGAGLLYWRLPKASVELLIEPKVLEEEFEVTLDPDLSLPDKETLSLPAEVLTASLQGEKTAGTTGTKLIGENAKGEVTIYNGTANKKTFEAGTLISSATGVEFGLDEEVSVASQSGTAANPEPGKATVGVTAVEIGSESNLAASTEFSVANYSQSDYVAKNESAFTGGTSREVQVVTAEDQENLISDLKAELEASSLERLTSQAASDQKLLEDSLESEVVKKDFDKEIEEEANEIKLNLELKLTVLVYREGEMENLIKEIIKDKIPANFEFRPEETRTEFEFNELSADGVALFKVRLFANLIPRLDLGKIKEDLKGKYPVVGTTYLENLPHIAGAEVKITPKLPAKLMTFPRKTKNIEIEVRVKS